MRISSLCFAAAYGAGALALVFLGFSFYEKEVQFLYFTGAFAGASIITGFLALLTGTKCQCQLCQVSLMSYQKYSKHRNAKRLLGSYRLKLSLSVLTLNRYICGSCGETFSCNVPEIFKKPQQEPEVNATISQLNPVRRSLKPGALPGKKHFK